MTARAPAAPRIAAILCFAAAAAIAPPSARTQQPPAGAAMRRNVAILVYDGVQVLDFAGAFEVFSRLNQDNVYLVAQSAQPVRTWRNLTVTPTYTLDAAPRPDVVVVPGGDTRQISHDSSALGWVRNQARDSAYVLAICSGTFVLLRAGLLDGRAATTFWRLQDALRQQGQPRGVRVVSDRPVVRDGRVVTAAGTGIEGALLVLGALHGEAFRRLVALHMELDPDPELETTHRSRMADLDLPDLDRYFPSDSATLLEYAGDETSWTERWRYPSAGPAAAAAERLEQGIRTTTAWRWLGSLTGDGWESHWAFTGRDGRPWLGAVELDAAGGAAELAVHVWRRSLPTR